MLATLHGDHTLLIPVAFVADEDLLDAFGGVLLDVGEPGTNIWELVQLALWREWGARGKIRCSEKAFGRYCKEKEWMHTAKRLLIRNIIHQQYAHRASVVRRRDCPEALLPGGVPYLQLDALAVQLDRPDLEVDAYGRDERGGEGVFAEAEQAARLANAGVADQKELYLCRSELAGWGRNLR